MASSRLMVSESTRLLDWLTWQDQMRSAHSKISEEEGEEEEEEEGTKQRDDE